MDQCGTMDTMGGTMGHHAGDDLEEFGGWRDVAGVADHRLQNDSRDLALVRLEDLFDALHVVVGGG